MATRGDAVQAAQETARLGISTVVEGVATGIIEIGAATPFVAPLCVALIKAKGVVDGASRNKEELAELCELCDLITVQVIDKAKDTPTIDVSPLQKCIDKLNEVAKRYHDQGWLARLAQFRRDGDDIQRLRARIEAVVPIMGLAGVVNIMEGVANIGDRYEDLRQIMARLQPRPRLAPVPPGAPVGQSWHAARDGVVDRVCEILCGDGGPALVALTGRRGTGKTTAAAAMVVERQGPIRPLAHETEDQARTRLDRLRARFSDGVVWLRVGKGEGAADRLPSLMRKLAKRLHEDVMKSQVYAPALGEAGEIYVKKIVEQKSLRCLVVADDVREAKVVEKLRYTGMWVLLTTRFPEMVEPNEMVVVDKLEKTEAENVLRGAARLPPDQRLCDAAIEVLKICGYMAMDIAFVGSWRLVRTASGVPKSIKAWARAVTEITAQIDDVIVAGGMDDLDVNRLAILRAGFKYLGVEDPLAQELYVSLAVFPDGHSFKELDAAVLLDDEEAAAGPISVLERWAVLRADNSGRYHMHDAHADFARDKLMNWADIRKPAVDRWTSHISRLDFAVGIDVYALLNIWRAVERVGGDGLWVSRPYGDELVEMDASDPSKILAVHVVATLFEHDRKFGELEALMKRVLEHDDHEDADVPGVQMVALYYTCYALGWQGRVQESDAFESRLGELGSPGVELPLPSDGAGFLQVSTTFSIYGACAKAAGRLKDAEEWFRKALKALEGGGLTGSDQNVWALVELGWCVRLAGRPEEAENLFKRALTIQEVKLGDDDPQVAVTLYSLGQCVQKAARPREAEAWFRRVLEIQEAKLGADDVGVAYTLRDIGRCVRETGRLEEAEALFRRALQIQEAKLGADDLQVAVTLRDILRCVPETEELSEREHDDLQRFRDCPEAVKPVPGVSNIEDQVEDMRPMLARLHSRPTIASVPMGAWVMNVLPFTDFPGLCQCLLINRHISKGVKCFLSNLVVGAEESQGWTVPVDELKLAPREISAPPKLVSAGCVVSIEGPEDGLRRLNALLVPAPMFLEVDSKTYISLAPVLRCRWRGQDSKGPWVVHFSMADIGGFDHNFSKLVSVFRRPTASLDGKWELLDSNVDKVEEAWDGEETVSVEVAHFSDLIATVEEAKASEKSKGYIIKPIRYKFLRVFHTRVLVHNASTDPLSFFQRWPRMIRTSTEAGVQVLGSGVSLGKGILVRDPKEFIDEGHLTPWPRNPIRSNKFGSPLPEPKKLDTQKHGLKLSLVVYTGVLENVEVLATFECDGGNDVILLEGIDRKRVADPRTKAKVGQILGF